MYFREMYTRYIAEVLCEEIESFKGIQKAIPDRSHAWSHITNRRSENFPQEVIFLHDFVYIVEMCTVYKINDKYFAN